MPVGHRIQFTPDADQHLQALRSPVSFSPHFCFVCARRVSPLTPPGLTNSRTKEDVISSWIGRSFKVEGKTTVLTNGKRKLINHILPFACGECNNRRLSDLEKKVSGHFLSGTFLSEQDLALWISKVFFGIRHSELNFRDDNFRPLDRPILSPGNRSLLVILRILLNSIYQPVNYRQFHYFGSGPHPWSILPVKINDPDAQRFAFQFAGNLMALQLGSTGIIAAYDGGWSRFRYINGVRHLEGLGLSSGQFMELAANLALRLYSAKIALGFSVQLTSLGEVVVYLNSLSDEGPAIAHKWFMPDGTWRALYHNDDHRWIVEPGRMDLGLRDFLCHRFVHGNHVIDGREFQSLFKSEQFLNHFLSRGFNGF